MYEHHQRTIEKATAFYRQDPNILAVIVGGSVAKGVARPGSDVDLMLVTTAKEFARRRAEKAYSTISYEFHDYEGGYTDIKFVDEAFLIAAAERGSEPTRDSFTGAYPVWSKIDELAKLISQIPVYPECERAEKMRAFYSQALLQRYFIGHDPSKYPYLVADAAVTMVLFGGRLLLAHNRVLFPSRKRLLERVVALADKPINFLPLAETLLREPIADHAKELMACLDAFHDWGMDWDAAPGQFVGDAEFNWLETKPPLADS